MAHVLFVYSTVDGHTLEICQRLQSIVEEAGHQATLYELTPNDAPDPAAYDTVVIGASVRYGKHRPEVARFIDEHESLLSARPSALFSVNAVARKPEKQSPETNPYVKKFLKSISWRPAVIEIFGGKIDYPKYTFWDRNMIRFIMWMTKGPTNPSTIVDFTDWDQVEAFGRKIHEIS